MTTIGIDIGGTKMCICAGPPDHRVFSRFPTGAEITPQELEHMICGFVAKLADPPNAIGIAVPGLVSDQKVIACDVLPNLVGWEPARIDISCATISVMNDADALASEVIKTSSPTDLSVVVAVGTGIGGSIINEGALIRGASGGAGEIGWFPVIADGALVRLDDVAGGAALLKKIGGDVDEIGRRLKSDDRLATKAVTDAGRALGLAIGSLICLLNPNRIVIVGGTLRYPGYLEAVMTAAKEGALPEAWEGCEIHVPEEGETWPARGAAATATDGDLSQHSSAKQRIARTAGAESSD
ncbi:MAG: ROK family protein [Rhodobacteraceae bacterium]|nr:ROK family protein [Paracoccaceae bacterium]